MAQNSMLCNYTIAVTKNQTSGRGQMNNTWVSEPNKNLTFSLFTRLQNLQVPHQPYLNFAISLAIFNVLKLMSVPNLKIKWPNDIMSGNQKICGILVETTFTNQRIKNTIIGIGLNVNQEGFPSHIINASSLKNILHQEFDVEKIMLELINEIQSKIGELEHHNFELIYEMYLTHLYQKDIPAAFRNEKTGLFFMGIIKSVSHNGNLRILLEDDSVVEFGIKEVSLAKV